MLPTSEEVDMIRPGEAPPSFVPGGELTMRPSKMGIPAAATTVLDPEVPPSSGRETPSIIQARQPGTQGPHRQGRASLRRRHATEVRGIVARLEGPGQ